MNEIDQYVQQVLLRIHAPAAERQRIEGDLRAHLQEATSAGQSAHAVIDHMGSPSEVAAEFMSQIRLHYAGFPARLAAFVIDWLILVACVCLITGAAALLSSGIPRNPQGLEYAWGAILILVIAGLALADLGVIILYFPIQEARFGQTIGKKQLGLSVLQETGLPIGYKEAFLRRLSFYFDFWVIDALFIFFTAKKQRAFDIVARTVVVTER